MYKVLVVDDEVIERKVVCKTLNKYLGDLCMIYEAKSGREAIEIFEKEKVQIIILDIEMPGMNGLEAAKIMRQFDENCVIIFLTAYDVFEYAKQAITVRALDYLLKPYDDNELICVMEEAMRQVNKANKSEILDVSAISDIIKENTSENVRLSLLKDTIENYIKDHYAEDIAMHDLARIMNYSEAYFCKLFKQCFKVNFTTYLANYRVEIAKIMLEEPMTNVKAVGISCGYPDSNYFSRVFKRATGTTPTEYRTKKLNEKWIK